MGLGTGLSKSLPKPSSWPCQLLNWHPQHPARCHRGEGEAGGEPGLGMLSSRHGAKHLPALHTGVPGECDTCGLVQGRKDHSKTALWLPFVTAPACFYSVLVFSSGLVGGLVLLFCKIYALCLAAGCFLYYASGITGEFYVAIPSPPGCDQRADCLWPLRFINAS